MDDEGTLIIYFTNNPDYRLEDKTIKKEYKTDVSSYKAIRDWREDERPRERLLKHGSSSLSDAELLAIIIRSGSVRFSAIDAARALLEMFGTLSKLASCDTSEIKRVKGIGDAKAVELSAAFEIARRIQAEPFDINNLIHSPEDVAKYYIPKMRDLRTENFRVLLLNSSNRIFRELAISEGTLNASIVHPREVFRFAISESAASIILLHNHPSGNPEPSKEDITITKKLVSAGELIDIKVLDHIIIAGETFTSLMKRGLM